MILHDYTVILDTRVSDAQIGTLLR